MTGGHTLDVVFQNAPHLVLIVGVHDEHDGLLEEGVLLTVGLLLQRQQTVLTGDLGEIDQLVDVLAGVVELVVQDDLKVLGHRLEHLPREAGHDDEDRAPDGDEDTGWVKEILDICKVDGDWRFGAQLDAGDHTEDTDHNGANQTDNII